MLTIKYQTAFKKDFEDKACSQFLLQIILDKNGLNVQKHETTLGSGTNVVNLMWAFGRECD